MKTETAKKRLAHLHLNRLAKEQAQLEECFNIPFPSQADENFAEQVSKRANAIKAQQSIVTHCLETIEKLGGEEKFLPHRENRKTPLQKQIEEARKEAGTYKRNEKNNADRDKLFATAEKMQPIPRSAEEAD